MLGLVLFDPKGAIALQERNLLVVAVLLMLCVVVPVFVLLITFARKYRASNPKAANYAPDGKEHPAVGFAFWAILVAIISALGVMNWKSTHALDPSKPIAAGVAPLTIQVVALPWKWLFIYPQQNIATVNFLQLPVGTPLNFELTADAPMSSFWIPQLGGQMYAMTGMSTQLHLVANAPGDFRGLAAEINGRGFAGMTFVARAASQYDFDQWVARVKEPSSTLTLDLYNQLAAPSENNPMAFYASVDPCLYNEVIAKFMAPTDTSSSMPMTPGMHM
jgi:cytochrome o ubiquinol oxidase subunit 2